MPAARRERGRCNPLFQPFQIRNSFSPFAHPSDSRNSPPSLPPPQPTSSSLLFLPTSIIRCQSLCVPSVAAFEMPPFPLFKWVSLLCPARSAVSFTLLPSCIATPRAACWIQPPNLPRLVFTDEPLF
ncbi:UNVERIFIED_CONTAM: hypothetical protein Slati_3093600 [Sesamum latifolium]|uniref:Uncharacterized protein n=1 Tax=Sesamum latifolium TaxID=2727402 RepID=A0AAW2UW27_9LAMI